jgi:hypothetical protein
MEQLIKAKKQQLIFVYNANSGLFNSLTDFAHKIISPSSYQCQLCALTYGNFSMKQEWKTFLESFPVTTTTIFLHKDEFVQQYKINTDFPAVFIKPNDTIKPFVTKHEIETCQSLQQLKDLILLKISAHDQHNHSNI